MPPEKVRPLEVCSSSVALESVTSQIRLAATLTWGSMMIAKETERMLERIMPMYWITAKISPAVRPEPRSIRTPPRKTTSRAARFRTKQASGSTIDMWILARMMLSDITRVASLMRSWDLVSRSKARITRMPRRRSRTRSFCRSQYLSETSQRPVMRLLIRSTAAITTGTARRMTRESITSLRMQSSTPPRNISGMMIRLPQIMETTQFRLPTSWVIRVTRLDVPRRPTSSSVIVWTLSKIIWRRSQV